MKLRDYLPDSDVPDLSGKAIFVTGGTAGLGASTIEMLAKHRPGHIYFSGRNASKADELIARIKQSYTDVTLTFVQLDLASHASVREAIGKLSCPRLDVLICNAGIMAVPPGLTTDGYEIQFGTNHLGHALLIQLLLPTLLRIADEPGSDVRIVILTSAGYALHPKEGILFDQLRTTQDCGLGGSWMRYGQSKLANLLYAAELARRYPAITSVAVHPGVAFTGLVDHLGPANKALVYLTTIGQRISPEQGTFNSLWAATSAKDGMTNGAYYEPVGELGRYDKSSRSAELAKHLWDWTEKELIHHQ